MPLSIYQRLRVLFLAPTMSKDQIIVVNLSGRGDKDVAAIARYRGEEIHE